MNLFYLLNVLLFIISTIIYEINGEDSPKSNVSVGHSQCELNKDCVECLIHKSGPLDEEACNECRINPIGSSQFDVREGEELCVFNDDKDCKFQFKYKYNDQKKRIIYIIADYNKVCPLNKTLNSKYLNTDPCTSKETCSECVTANPECAWCMKRDFVYHRCDYYYIHRLSNQGCFDLNSIFYPGPSFTPLLNRELSSNILRIGHPIPPVQLKPQKVHLKLRPGLPYSVYIQYKQIFDYPSVVELKDNATDNVKINYFSSCLNASKDKTNICKGLRAGDSVAFDARVEVKSCPPNPNEWNQTVIINVEGSFYNLIINLEMICECNCEKPWNEQPNSSYCERRGTYECGICSCNDNYNGRRCQHIVKVSDTAEEELSCINGNDTITCSGRGVCRYGECECHIRGVTGKYCECDNFSCDRYDDKVCGGSDRGLCVCGVCHCKEDWTGQDCSCKKSISDCIDPKTQIVCNGRGNCVCGVCLCESVGEEQYTGKYCEDCPNCISQCDRYKECVQCRIHQSGPLGEEACNRCSVNPIGTSEFEVQEGEQLCVFIDDDDCKFQFKYKYDDQDGLIYVIAQNTKDCPQPVDVFPITTLFNFMIGLIPF